MCVHISFERGGVGGGFVFWSSWPCDHAIHRERINKPLSVYIWWYFKMAMVSTRPCHWFVFALDVRCEGISTAQSSRTERYEKSSTIQRESVCCWHPSLGERRLIIQLSRVDLRWFVQSTPFVPRPQMENVDVDVLCMPDSQQLKAPQQMDENEDIGKNKI